MDNTEGSDVRKSAFATWIPIVVSIMTLVGGGAGWLISQVQSHNREQMLAAKDREKSDDTLLAAYLDPLIAAMKLSDSDYDQLKQHFVPRDSGVLEWYVAASRKDGAGKYALAYGLMTDMIEENAKMIALLDGYEPKALTQAFRDEAEKFREHANTYAIRFRALPSIISTGEQLPSWKPLPAGLPSAIQEELLARKKHALENSRASNKDQFTRRFTSTLRTHYGMSGGCSALLEPLRNEYQHSIVQLVGQRAAVQKDINAASGGDIPYICNFDIAITDEY